MDRLQQDYAQLKAQWAVALDMTIGLGARSTMHNLTLAAYYDSCPGSSVCSSQRGRFGKNFYQAADKLAEEPKKERQQSLRTMGAEEKKQLLNPRVDSWENLTQARAGFAGTGNKSLRELGTTLRLA